MEVNGSLTINSLFVGRDATSSITLYGAYYEQSKQILVVVRSTRNIKSIILNELFGKEYTEEYLIKLLNERPTRNFIVNSSGPLTLTIDMDKVIFID